MLEVDKLSVGVELEVGIVDIGLKKPYTSPSLSCLDSFLRWRYEENKGHIPDQEPLFRGILSNKRLTQTYYTNVANDNSYLLRLIEREKGVLRRLFPDDKNTKSLKIACVQAALYSMLPFYISCIDQQMFGYDSEAVEVRTKPSFSFEDQANQLSDRVNILAGSLEPGLRLFFSGRYPANPLDLWSRYAVHETVNSMSFQIHLGNFRNLRESLFMYEYLRSISPELVSIFCSLGRGSRVMVSGLQIPPSAGNLDLDDNELVRVAETLFGKNSRYERSTFGEANYLFNCHIPGRKLPYFPREASTVFLRPELGTVEIRLLDTQRDSYKDLEPNILANIAALEFVYYTAQNAIRSFRDGKADVIQGIAVLRYDMALQRGLGNNLLLENSKSLLDCIRRQISKDSLRYIDGRFSKSH